MKNIEVKFSSAVVLALFLLFIWLGAHPSLWDRLIAFLFGVR